MLLYDTTQITNPRVVVKTFQKSKGAIRTRGGDFGVIEPVSIREQDGRVVLRQRRNRCFVAILMIHKDKGTKRCCMVLPSKSIKEYKKKKRKT